MVCVINFGSITRIAKSIAFLFHMFFLYFSIFRIPFYLCKNSSFPRVSLALTVLCHVTGGSHPTHRVQVPLGLDLTCIKTTITATLVLHCICHLPFPGSLPRHLTTRRILRGLQGHSKCVNRWSTLVSSTITATAQLKLTKIFSERTVLDETMA